MGISKKQTMEDVKERIIDLENHMEYLDQTYIEPIRKKLNKLKLYESNNS